MPSRFRIFWKGRTRIIGESRDYKTKAAVGSGPHRWDMNACKFKNAKDRIC